MFQSVCPSMYLCVNPEQTLLARYLGWVFVDGIWPNFHHQRIWGKDEHIKFWGQGSRSLWGQICPEMHLLALQLSHVGGGVIVNRVITTV